MSEIEHSIQSTAKLFKALALSLLIALTVFVTIVLPAEFGVDPTGVGSMLGLNALRAEDANPEVISRPGEGDLLFRQDEIEILVPANDGLEYKFFLYTHSNLNYEWNSTSSLYFDMHGEPDGDTTGYFESYGAATVDEMSGSVTVPFAGSHGWYWRNDSGEDISISLKTLGNYDIIGLN